MQSDKRVKNEETRLVSGYGGLEPAAVVGPVQPQGVGCDDPKRKPVEVNLMIGSKRLEALADGGSGILGRIK
jgi:hypothetical protein